MSTPQPLSAVENPPATPFEISLIAQEDESRKGVPETLLGGRLRIRTPRGLNAMDRILIEAADGVPGENVWVLMTTNAIPALALAALRPGARVTHFHLDAFYPLKTRRQAARHGLENLAAISAPNLPEDGPAPDLILLHTRQDGIAGLTMELLHQCHLRLKLGGKLLASTNNARDRWLHDNLQKLFGNLTLARNAKRGRVYSVKRKGKATPEEEAAERALTHFVKTIEIEFYELGRMEFETCYGAFGSEGLDTGTLALLETLPRELRVGSILDLGCGWGPLGILAAKRHGASRLTMIDSHARAVEMARRNAERHGLGAAADVRHEAQCESILNNPDEWGQYDLVLSNAPYATDFHVAETFLRAAHAALAPGGSCWLVAKENARLGELFAMAFGEFRVAHRRGYAVYIGEKRLEGSATTFAAYDPEGGGEADGGEEE